MHTVFENRKRIDKIGKYFHKRHLPIFHSFVTEIDHIYETYLRDFQTLCITIAIVQWFVMLILQLLHLKEHPTKKDGFVLVRVFHICLPPTVWVVLTKSLSVFRLVVFNLEMKSRS